MRTASTSTPLWISPWSKRNAALVLRLLPALLSSASALVLVLAPRRRARTIMLRRTHQGKWPPTPARPPCPADV